MANAKSKSRSATGPKPGNQGKFIPNSAAPARKGKTTGNGNWDECSEVTKNASTPVIRGTGKSF
jgi:hypothetical protein